MSRYDQFKEAHKLGYTDRFGQFDMQPRFEDAALEQAYLAGYRMACLPRSTIKNYGDHTYWAVWIEGSRLADKPYWNPHPLNDWRHLAFLSGWRAFQCAMAR